MHATINRNNIQFEKNDTILKTAKRLGIYIPTLCELQDIDHNPGTCRVCLVEIKRKNSDKRHLVTACNTPMEEGLEVFTNSPVALESRKTQIELVLSDHNRDCLTCVRNGECELQELASFIHPEENHIVHSGVQFSKERSYDPSSPSLVRDMSKCVRCLRCVKVCRDGQGIDGLVIDEHGTHSQISPKDALNLLDSNCIACGQCVQVCPVGALSVRNDTDKVMSFLQDPAITTVFQFAPAVRVALGEELGLPAGKIMTGQMYAALKKLGADVVLDTNFAADLVIMEEGTELLERVKGGGTLPLFTSCSPGWVNFLELNYPELLGHLSTTKSPQQCFGALAKTYLAEKMQVDPKKMRVISIMPCTAKKYEAAREEFKRDGQPDVDVVLTTAELGKLLKSEFIEITTLESAGPTHEWMGNYTGAGVLFGVSGGVTEAALRTLYALVNGKELENLEIQAVRGKENIREAEIELSPEFGKVKVALVHGLKAARDVVEEVKAGKSPYTFIEFMACPGGCINGGGQPRKARRYKANWDQRLAAIYQEDRNLPIRQSHKNPDIQKIYAEFLDKPNSHKSQELLHTHYKNRKRAVTRDLDRIWSEIDRKKGDQV